MFIEKIYFKTDNKLVRVFSTLLNGAARVLVSRADFPDGVKRGNCARRHHVGGRTDETTSRFLDACRK